MGDGLPVHVSYCNLKEIFIPANVTSIHAKNNKISTINFQSHNNLQYLDVSHNNLTNIADQISNLKSLNSLYNLNIACNPNKVDFTKLYDVKNIGQLTIDYNPNQNIRIDEMKRKIPNLHSLSYSVFHGMNFQQYLEMDKNCEQHGIIFGLKCVDAWGEVHNCRMMNAYKNRFCECLIP